MHLFPLLAALVVGQASVAQGGRVPLPPGTSTISGVVTDALSKQPIKGCRIYLVQLVSFRPASGGATMTGPDGTYSFSDIVDGEYAINPSCEGYLVSCHRSPGPDPQRCYNVAVVVDQKQSSIDFTLTPEARARGRVADSRGRPIRGATVRLGMPLVDTPAVMNRSAQTDQEGRFELRGLPAGEWRLEVDLPAGSDGPRPPIVYFPGVLAQSEAGSLELVAGKTLEGVNVVAPSLEDNRLTVRMVTVDLTLSKVDLSLVRLEPLMSRRIVVDDTGTGSVTGLIPGRYFLAARGYAGDRLSIAHDVLDFAGGSQEVLLYVQPSARIAGRVIGDKGVAPSLDGVRVGAAWIHEGVEVNPLSVDEAAVTSDGTFRFEGLFGTRHLRLFGLDPAFKVLSISEGRTDVTDSGVVLTADAEANVVIVVGRR